jgi:glutaredoxin
MLTLYVKTGCPFCNKTLPLFNSVEKEEKQTKNIAEPGVAEELIAKGGKQQVPYLVDDKTDASMYESDDIIAYLKKEYGAGEGKEEESTDAPNVCSI